MLQLVKKHFMRWTRWRALLLLPLFLVSDLSAQLPPGASSSSPTIVDSTYIWSQGQPIAPGHIITLIVRGLKAGGDGPRTIRASSLPVPRELAGITARIEIPGAESMSMPILRVDDVSRGPLPYETGARAVTVQVPFELGRYVSTPRPIFGPFISVSEAGASPVWTRFLLFSARPWIIGQCEYPVRTEICEGYPLIAHADGSMVYKSRPAQPGEVIVIYALGLGATVPPVGTGEAAPSPAPRTAIIWPVMFTIRDYERETRLSQEQVTSEFSGMVSGTVGLYQVNVQVPSTPAFYAVEGAPTCGADQGVRGVFVSVALQLDQTRPICVALPTPTPGG